MQASASVVSAEALSHREPRLSPRGRAPRDRVEIAARYEGPEQHGEASFHADPAERRIEWSSPSGYRGWMSVAPDGEGSRLTLFLDTRHSSERDHGIAVTLDAIRMLVESEVDLPNLAARSASPLHRALPGARSRGRKNASAASA
jgi:hypothetical protein